MTHLEYLLDCRERYTRWMSMTAEELSKVGAGGLTHEKVYPLARDVELELIDHERYTADGRMTYAQEAA